MKNKRLYSVQLKIIVIILCIVVSLACLMLATAFNINKDYKELILEAYRSFVDKECDEIDRSVFEIENNTYELANKGRVLYQTDTIEKLGAATVMDSFSDHDIAVGGGIWFEPETLGKRVYFYAYRDAGGEEVIAPSNENYDYTMREWYIQAKEGGERGEKYTWTEPYYDMAGPGTLVVTVGCAIYADDGKFLGTADSDWELSDISTRIEKLEATENSFSIFANTASKSVLADTMKADIRGKVSLPYSLDSLEWFYPAIEKGGVQLNGKEFLVASYTLKNGMIAAVFVPENELYGEANKEMDNTVMMLVIAIIAIVAGSYIMLRRFISKPVAEISAKVAMIGKGDLDMKIEIKSTGEFGMLARAFNDMTKHLKEHIRNITVMTSEKERIGAELTIATEIQESLLPTTFPAFPDRTEFDLYAVMEPAKEVGGDFYDFYYTDKDHLALVIADVAGKGVPAALFMVIAKTLLKNHLQMGEGPVRTLRNVNDQLCENNDVGMSVTAFIAVLTIATGEISYANAGHYPPLVMREGKPFEALDAKSGFVLGERGDREYAGGKIKLNVGDVLYFYTDGVTEAENGKGELFGEERMFAVANLAGSGSVRSLVERVRAAVDGFAGGAPQLDDITMLALRYDGPNGGGGEGADRGKDEARSGAPSSAGEVPPASLTLPAEVDRMNEALDFIEAAVGSAGADPKTLMQIRLAAEEIFVNIAKYAYAESGEEPRAWISAGSFGGGEIRVTFKDRGAPYNPLEHETPDVTLSAEARAIGGLGVFMVTESMDDVEYAYEDGFNVLTLIKKL
jgi:sigma-B regulation protein RsbU (phosphoserine phosphatase)